MASKFGKVGLRVLETIRCAGRSYFPMKSPSHSFLLKLTREVASHHAFEEGPNGPGNRTWVALPFPIEPKER